MSLYTKTSPYFITGITNNYLDVIAFRDFPKEADDVLWEVTKNYEFRPDLLAYDLYSEVGLWWVFSVRNPNVLKDPVFDLLAGTKIFLPKQSTLKQSLSV